MSENSKLYKLVADEESFMTKEEISMFLYGSQDLLDIMGFEVR